MRIEGTVAVITGASFGIGAATAKAMARHGARVILLARTQPALESVAAEIGDAAHAYAVDLTDADAVKRVAHTILQRFGAPDIVVNCAGAGRWLTVEETSPEEAVGMMAAPYFAAFYVTHAFLPHMLRRGSGRFVNIGSPATRLIWPGATGYIAARWAFQGFTEALRADLRGTGIGVSSVVPGTVDTTYFTHNPGVQERIPRATSIGRVLTREAVAETVVNVIRKEKREVVFPLSLRMLSMAHALFPRIGEWVGCATGWKRSAARQARANAASSM
jgi:short-subunit dehydrogenase